MSAPFQEFRHARSRAFVSFRCADVLRLWPANASSGWPDTGGRTNVGAQPASQDFSTPEKAILSLEDAYRAKDVEAAVRCKDFPIEAKLMLQKLQTDFSNDAEIIAKTAEVLELGFRSEMKNSGFPDFRNVTSTFPSKKPYQGRDDIVEVTESVRSANGQVTTTN